MKTPYVLFLDEAIQRDNISSLFGSHREIHTTAIHLPNYLDCSNNNPGKVTHSTHQPQLKKSTV